MNLSHNRSYGLILLGSSLGGNLCMYLLQKPCFPGNKLPRCPVAMEVSMFTQGVLNAASFPLREGAI